MADTTTYPRQSARTQRFTLGAPRSVAVSADGQRVAFLRSAGGQDPVTALWLLDVASGEERLVADPATLLGGDVAELIAEERALRERAREAAGGITSFALDHDGGTACFALSGRLFLAPLSGAGEVRELAAATGVFDPRLSPDGRLVSYCAGGGLHIADVGGTRELVAEEGVSWGLAEFVAAEEMGRYRGHWWSPDSARLLVARVDERPVQTWWVADPANPDRRPGEQRYPAAGTANAEVTLWLVDLDGERTEVRWDRAAFEYVAGVAWSEAPGLVILVQSRDQRRLQWLEVDPATGATSVRREAADDDWLELVDGTPAWTASGRLVAVLPSAGSNRLHLDGQPVTPVGLEVSAVLSVDGEDVLVAATDEPTESHVYLVSSTGAPTRLTERPGVHSGRLAGGTLVISSAVLSEPGTTTVVHRAGAAVATLSSYAETPVLRAAPQLLRCGSSELRTAVLLPEGWSEADGRLPVLLDPYGGPHAQRVLAAHNAFLAPQWFANQGFAVVVVDGRGTPGRGPAWERSIVGRWGDAVLEDQVSALHEAAARFPGLDLDRVAIRGWSYGGYLAALAVLRRPDVFHAAVAGAPVTDWALYDTHYTERYLGTDPNGGDSARYAAESLLADAQKLSRPLMLIHGLADDNVVAAHTLRLSAALLAAGRPHEVLPLSGVTHMTPQEEVAENLLLLQVDFLRRALAHHSPTMGKDAARAPH